MKNKEYDPNRKWLIEVNEVQLFDIINGMEDIHRFLGGDTRMNNTTCYAKGKDVTALRRELDGLHQYITPNLGPNQCYDWCGSGCKDKNQKEAIQRTYAIYRNLRHCVEKFRDAEGWNVYKRETLTCGHPLAICYPKNETTD